MECKDKEFNSYFNSAKKHLSNLKKEKILPVNVITSGLIMSHCHGVDFLDRSCTDLAKNPDQKFEVVLADMKAAAQAHKHSQSLTTKIRQQGNQTKPNNDKNNNNNNNSTKGKQTQQNQSKQKWNIPDIPHTWQDAFGEAIYHYICTWRQLHMSNPMSSCAKVASMVKKTGRKLPVFPGKPKPTSDDQSLHGRSSKSNKCSKQICRTK